MFTLKCDILTAKVASLQIFLFSRNDGAAHGNSFDVGDKH